MVQWLHLHAMTGNQKLCVLPQLTHQSIATLCSAISAQHFHCSPATLHMQLQCCNRCYAGIHMCMLPLRLACAASTLPFLRQRPRKTRRLRYTQLSGCRELPPAATTPTSMLCPMWDDMHTPGEPASRSASTDCVSTAAGLEGLSGCQQGCNKPCTSSHASACLHCWR